MPALAAHFLDREIPELESPDLGDPPHVLTGTAGVGKTQLAVRFAEQAWDDDDIHLLLWVDASARESVVAAYAHAAEDLYGRAYPDPAAGALAFLNWLRPAGGKHDHPWLIVLDGVTDPADLTDLWPPSTTGGYVLVTSRRRDFTRAGAAAKPVVVAVPDFTRPEIRTYLQNALDHRELGSPDTDPVAQRIAELGGVGTFIWSAAREIARFGLPLDTYLDRLGGGAPAETALYAAQWQSIEAAQRLAPAGLALPVLQLLVTVGRMPEQVLFAPPVLELLNHTPDKAPEAAPDVSAADVRATLRLLHSMSLLDESRAGAYRVAAAARGTQRAVAAATDAGTVRTVVGALADALALVWPEAEPDEAAAQLLWYAVCDLLKAQSGVPLVSSDGIHPVVFRAGNSRGEWGWEDEAEEFFDGLDEYAEGVLDDQHPDRLKAAACAGRWRAARGADGAAVALLAEVLADQREALAADHPDVLTTRHHLAWSRLATEGWDAVQPRAELTAVLRDRGTVLGPQHPDTLRTLSALVEAMVLRPAEVAGEDVVAVAIGLFGLPAAAGTLETEPDVVAFAAQSVTLLRRHLGPAHLATLDARRLLALARLRAGDAEAALEEATEAGVAVRQAFGPEHPLTLRCRALVGLAQYRTGAEADAYSTLDAVCNDQLTMLGPDHPDALQTSAYLLPVDGDSRPPRDDRGRLLTECATLLADVERVFGPDHTRTLAVLDDIGHAQGTFGLHIAAVATFADLAGRCARLRGPDHPETLRARHRLAWHRAAAGDWLGGVAGLAPVIGDFTRILGRDHETTRTARLHLAWFRGEAGDVLGATTDLTLLLADCERTPGADSPAAAAARDALAHWQSRG
ncbi:hypothetical protein [Actinacidiphila epipremni]|uniref:Tetratricopeptide repeat protein n=1 Tax=Actinacidiphila epipremni TaxID=2053013 RepID=A0ABX0ZP56_9ACTN|nr:hypothetical protein [Actinacidiphila epipremni]NJP43373.1 hypothetical protein [Actinacidiphila epipremni]